MTKGQIFFTDDLKNDFSGFCKKNHKEHIVFICDVNTEKFCLPYFPEAEHVIVIPAGELTKDIDTYSFIVKKLIFCKANKSTLVVNLGGGVVSDIGGFAASTFMRGIDYINIPTSLLGMVDAAIGGKTGVDFQLNKNYIGTYALPEAIFIYPPFLQTLPKEEFMSGTAEIIKAGVIANQLLFMKINENAPVESLIHLAAETKHQITARDLHDRGERQLLNFGHTIGHAYESYRLNIEQPIMHGFAVAKGMMAEARIAYYLELVNEEELNIIIDCVALHTLQSEITHVELDAIAPLLLMDKKNSHNEIIFSLPYGIGSGKAKVPVALDVIEKSLFNA